MKRWGIVITAFYVVAIVVMVVPGVMLYMRVPFEGSLHLHVRDAFDMALDVCLFWGWWIWAVTLVSGQALLLFLSVDTSWRRLKPRQHVAVTTVLAGSLTALLTFGAIWSLAAGVFGEKVFDWPWPLSPWNGKGELFFGSGVLGWWAGLWAIWGSVFYLYYRNVPEPLARIVSWLLRGSVLELLIAVPAHIVVRHRDDCSAPVLTGWGIVTGIAVMLLCFGPGVLALYKRKLDAYSQERG